MFWLGLVVGLGIGAVTITLMFWYLEYRELREVRKVLFW